MARSNEIIGSLIGTAAGLLLGANYGKHTGISGKGGAVSGKVPFAVIGGVVLGLLANKTGSEIDRKAS